MRVWRCGLPLAVAFLGAMRGTSRADERPDCPHSGPEAEKCLKRYWNKKIWPDPRDQGDAAATRRLTDQRWIGPVLSAQLCNLERKRAEARQRKIGSTEEIDGKIIAIRATLKSHRIAPMACSRKMDSVRVCDGRLRMDDRGRVLGCTNYAIPSVKRIVDLLALCLSGRVDAFGREEDPCETRRARQYLDVAEALARQEENGPLPQADGKSKEPTIQGIVDEATRP